MTSTLKSIEERYLERRTAHAMRAGQKAQLDAQYMAALKEKAELERRQDLYLRTQALLVKASGAARALAQEKIEHLVTMALGAITGSPYRFAMEVVTHGGNPTVRFTVINPAGVELDPLDSCGGGIVDICSMALRIAILEMYEPKIEGPILLDEDFKFLSKDHIRATVEFLHTLVEKTGRQLILVTHDQELAAGADATFEVIPAGESSQILTGSSVEEADSGV
jgi:hypothetical protein